ncbi:cytochrome P450 27C1-like isoform X1 [Acipenser oxyrinchus oxyrinchus]|uniref:Cytochrome P450 27C1-like isoform X1 n=1 Tax=Acipenser oxyrinchus oxyrinchus TaxID=40147 RepID=A0AAD8G5G5_ACIOX|nr:cytochrome P450 27C1-like isoform X1 [Acipenser oxyrinchus oxyrinchus]
MISVLSKLESLRIGQLLPALIRISGNHSLFPWSRSVSSTAINEKQTLNTPDQAKSIHEMPGYGAWTAFYWLVLKGYLLKSHEMQLMNKKKYGPIWKTTIGRLKTISVADAALIEQVLRNEGKYPSRGDNREWKEYRILRGLENGPVLKEGEDWHKLRAVLNQKILKPTEAKLFDKSINEVVTDLIKRIQFVRDTKGSGSMVYDLTNEMYCFSFEGVSSVVLESRLGCLEPSIPKETQDFINSVGTMFRMFTIILALPKWTRSVLPFWNKYIQAWDTMFNFAKDKVDQRLTDIQAKLQGTEPVEGNYLTYLLSCDKLSQSEIYSSITELLLAGVDTTSNTISWAIYHLARNQELQKAVYKEVISVSPEDQIPTAQDLDKMPLVKAVVREVLRLYPVVPENARILETDIVLGDYHIPSQVLLVMCHYASSVDPSQFSQPLKFKPERWLKKQEILKPHPFSSIPFGYGVRGCIGRRIAELEMYLALSRLVKQFEIRTDPQEKEVTPMTRLLIVPGSPINLQFHDRNP